MSLAVHAQPCRVMTMRLSLAAASACPTSGAAPSGDPDEHLTVAARAERVLPARHRDHHDVVEDEHRPLGDVAGARASA